MDSENIYQNYEEWLKLWESKRQKRYKVMSVSERRISPNYQTRSQSIAVSAMKMPEKGYRGRWIRKKLNGLLIDLARFLIEKQ